MDPGDLAVALVRREKSFRFGHAPATRASDVEVVDRRQRAPVESGGR